MGIDGPRDVFPLQSHDDIGMEVQPPNFHRGQEEPVEAVLLFGGVSLAVAGDGGEHDSVYLLLLFY